MERRALLVGIDSYTYLRKLTGCVADVMALGNLLNKNDDGSSNYSCHLLTGLDEPVTRSSLKREWKSLFYEFTGDALFYFSGHGAPDEVGGYLCVEDSTPDDPGVSFTELLHRVNHCAAREVLIILDTCYGRFPGRSARLRDAIIEDLVQIREGVTILSAATSTGVAIETGGRGLFTNILTDALKGGAADLRGHVTPASAYNYVEQRLGTWDQRPVFHTNVTRFSPIRRCNPVVTDDSIRELPHFFLTPEYVFSLDPSYEHTHEPADKEKIEILSKFRVYRDAYLVRTDHASLSQTATKSGRVELTNLGQFYWHLANNGRI
jgi:hypothetical protein